MEIRNLFLSYQAQTSANPLGIVISHANGNYLFDVDGKSYLDLISGISVSSLGHNNTEVNQAIKDQLDKHLHVMVYGECIQNPQVQLCAEIVQLCSNKLDNVYLLSTGTEAVEAALKLSKKFTGRSKIISCKNAYHGSTHGSLSLMSSEYFTQNFRPLLPEVTHIAFNNMKDLDIISNDTACCICEVVQAEAGIVLPENQWLRALRKRCTDTGTLLVFDEIQSGMGKSGFWFSFQKEGVEPDILLLGKALGFGMPLSALVSTKQILSDLSDKPVLGHISTFAGHPLSCAAALKGISIMKQMNFELMVSELAQIFINTFKHLNKVSFRQYGLLMALEFESEIICKKIIHECLQNGIFTDWFLFAPNCMRLSPPLTLSKHEAKAASEIILNSVLTHI